MSNKAFEEFKGKVLERVSGKLNKAMLESLSAGLQEFYEAGQRQMNERCVEIAKKYEPDERARFVDYPSDDIRKELKP